MEPWELEAAIRAVAPAIAMVVFIALMWNYLRTK